MTKTPIFAGMFIGLCLLLFLAAGCSKPYWIKEIKPSDQPEKTALNGVKIGLLADSQIQTPESSWVPLITGKIEDVVVPVALRPPALNFYSKNLLRHFAMQLAGMKKGLIKREGEPRRKNVDVILYLGRWGRPKTSN